VETATLEKPGTDEQEPVTPPGEDESQRDVTEPPADDPQTPEPDGPNQPQDELQTDGTQSKLTLDAGGKAPTDSKLQVVGKAVSVEGEFKKGDRIRATVELEITGVKFQDKHDGPTGQVVASTRTGYGTIVGFARLS
jgi:ribosomal protein L21E